MRPTLLAALTLALLAPLSVASADNSSITFGSNTISVKLTTGSQTFGLADCNNNTSSTFTATYSSTVPASATLAIFLSTSTACTSATSGSTTGQSVSESSNTLPFAVNAQTVAGSSCPTNTTTTMYVCAVATASTSTSSPAYLPITYSSQPPATPTLTSAEGGDSLAHLKWTTASTNSINIYYIQLTAGFDAGVDPCHPPPVDAGGIDASWLETSADAGADASTSATVFDLSQFKSTSIASSTSGTSGTIVTGLSNGATYLFLLEAVDQYGNTSDQSNAIEVTPQGVLDFYSSYRCEGGQDQGGFGCTSAGAAALIPACGALAFALLRRRSGRQP